MKFNIKKPDKNGNLFKIIVISFGHLCHDIYTSFLSPILPVLIKKLELTYSNAGMISVMLRIPSLFNPFIGAYADRFDMKYFIIVSPAITATAMCLMGLAPDFASILLLALVAGVGSACFHVPAPVLLTKFAGRRVGAGMSSFQIGGELARTLGPVIVLGAISLWSIEGIYRLIPIGFICSFIFYIIFRDVPGNNIEAKHNVRGAIMKTIKNDRVLFFSITGILLSKSFSASLITAYLPTYLNVGGESLWFSGGALSIVEASAVAGVLISGTLSDRVGCKKMLFFITITTPIVMLMFLNTEGWLFIFSLVLLGLTAFSSAPVILSLIQRRRLPYPSIANGLYMTINFILSSCMILLAGSISDITGIEFTFKLFAACSPVGIIFVFFLKEGAN